MRKIGKKSALKRYYQQPSQGQLVETNLEKKTQEKINTMSSNDSLTMDFVLKNRKLLEHLKKCKVFLSKSMRKNLLKKYSLLNNPISRKMNQKKAPKGKRGRPKKNITVPSMLNGAATNEEVSASQSALIINTRETSPSKKTAAPSPTGKVTKSHVLTSTENRQNPGPIFIRLPPKTSKRGVHKRQMFGRSVDKTKLIRSFGKMVFKCHVRVKRLRKSDPIFTRKLKVNRKTVSFMETVEVFGESDVEFESDKSIESNKSPSSKMSRTSTPLRVEKKLTKQSTLKKPKVQNKSPAKRLKIVKEKVKKEKENKKQTSQNPRKPASPQKVKSPSPQKVKSPVKERSPRKQSPAKAKSPAKKPGSPEKKKTPLQSQNSPKKSRSPKKKDQQTNGIQWSLIDGKECYVKLNRSSTSLLNLSTTSVENGDVEESRLVDFTLDSNEAASDLNQVEKDNEVDSEVLNRSSANEVTNSNDDVEISDEGATPKEEEIINDEDANAENDTESVRLENEGEHDEEIKTKDVDDLEEDNENNEKSESSDVLMVESNVEKDSVEGKANDSEPNSSKKDDPGNSPDEIVSTHINNCEDVDDVEDETEKAGEEEENINNDTKDVESLEGQLNGNDEYKNNEPISVVADNEKDDDEISEKVISTPIHRRGKFNKIDKNEGKAVSSTPTLSGSKTNGTKQKSDATPLPTNPDDLFDLLKSNKLPENEPSINRIPSPTPDLFDDEEEHDGALTKDVQSPVADIAEESGSSANDTRFSLNTFFKSKNRSGNESPGKSPPSADEMNLKNPECNLDSPTTQEITI